MPVYILQTTKNERTVYRVSFATESEIENFFDQRKWGDTATIFKTFNKIWGHCKPHYSHKEAKLHGLSLNKGKEPIFLNYKDYIFPENN